MDIEQVDPPTKNRSIICTNIPPELLDKHVAKQHFRQFGRVLRMVIRPRSQAWIIEYDCTENAQMAILNGGEYKGHVFSVNWNDNSAVKKKKVKKDPDPDWDANPEIQEELQAMAATGAGFLKKAYKLRTGGTAVNADPPVKQLLSKGKKTLKRSWKVEAPKKTKPRIKGTIKKLNVWTPEQLELLNIIRQPALTTEEKYKVLDARDKLIRLRTKKEIDLKSTTRTIGTCPDMCPEKERLMRVVQHQVALYEQDASGRNMNPVLAIKQYSRSSADQEAPLPHELRPVSVLQLTMGYLMHRIMNLCDVSDVNLAEWYHFLWDRTRSIRKDITQQELCCQGSVALLEQCARFHIHCSARLAGEDPSAFDQKINTENLTKCLQTLKYLYHDLNLKGENCPNESEFRAYIILLNLNDGNFMWEVQQLKLEIQKSPEVKFALSVYSAIDKNNFVKFFKLVQSTNYLNACILLRYFIQIRTKALSAILKCYSPRSPYTNFPLSEIEKLLAFEDSDSALDFVVAHGLYLNPEETHIVLDKKSFQLPEIPYPLDRAVNVVESKRKQSVGEVVCGGPLPSPDFLNYSPFNSFNENGVLNLTGMLSDVIKGSENIVTTPTDDSITEDQADSPMVISSNEVSRSSPNIFTSTIGASEEQQMKAPDPSLPFWSIQMADSPSTNIFGNQAAKISESLPQFAFKPPLKVEQPSAPSIFGDQQKSVFSGEQKKPSSIFGATLTSTNIFSEQSKTNIFTEQPKKNIFMEQTKTNIFAEKPKTNIFAGQPKINIFAEPPKPNIFDDQESVQQKPSIFGNQPTSVYNKQKPSSIFGGSQKPTISGDLSSEQSKQVKHGGFAFDVGPSKAATLSKGGFPFDLQLNKNSEELSNKTDFGSIQFTKPSAKEEGLKFSSATSRFPGFTNSNIFAQGRPSDQSVATSRVLKHPIVTTSSSEQSFNKAEKYIFKPPAPVTSAADEEKKKAAELEKEKARLAELERQKKLEKEREERIKHEMEELRRRKLEEQERERKRKELEEKRRREELKRKIEIENLMEDLLTKVEETVKEERLKEISNNIVKHKMWLFVNKWRKKSASNKRKRQAMDQNPIWLPTRTTAEEALELFSDTQDLNLLNIKRYKSGKPENIAFPIEHKIPNLNVKSIYTVLMKSHMKIYQRLQKEIFWKVTVSLPDFREFKIGLNRVEEALTDIFQWKDRYGGTSVVNQYVGENRLNYAIEKKQGVHPFEGNSNGLIFIAHEHNGLFAERIKEGLKNYPEFSSAPIVVIFINNNPCRDAGSLLEMLDKNKNVSNYEILSCKFIKDDGDDNMDIVEAVDRSLVLLAEQIGKPPPLELNTLQNFLNTTIATELWKRISSYASWNSTYKRCLRSPNVVISLYNEAIEKLKEIALDDSSLKYSNFPDEFDKLLLDQVPDVLPCDYKYFPSFWKSDSYRCFLKKAFNTLQFPKYQSAWPPANEKELERDIFNYCSEILEQPEKPFFRVMAIILQNIDPTTNFDKVGKLLWTNIIEKIALDKLRERDFSLKHTEFNTKSIFQQLFVVYNRENLSSYINDEWFYMKDSVIETEVKHSSQKKKNKVKENITEFKLYDDDFDLDELEKSIRETNENVVHSGSKLQELQDFMFDLADLEESMIIQKKICANFEKTIQKALDLENK